jgi:hypothetical protein
MKNFLLIVTLAAVLTGLNAVKPLHVDDATFYFNAKQIAAHPFDPYGYVMLRWSDAVPALHALAPPVLPYWWAAAIRMFGDRPVLWKLWLFPFVLIFVASLTALLRRFAPSVATPLLILLVLSPVFLPSLNLMMDIPALALSLMALALFFRPCDRGAPAVALFAGLTAGLAMQTKYTALLTPTIILIYALFYRKILVGSAALLVAGLIFAAWETMLFFRYGESHFVYQLLQGENGDQPRWILLGCLAPLLGSASPTLALLALTILPAPRWLFHVAALLSVLPFLLLGCPDAVSGGGRVYELAEALFVCNGIGVLLSVVWSARRLVAASGPLAGSKSPPKHVAWFLVFWFALELAGYLAISPFPAVRRIMGATVAATMLIGCLADQTPLETWRKNMLYGLVVVTVLLGLGFFAVDYLEARAEQQAAFTASQWIHQEHRQATIWYAGFWGFQFYAEKCGMKQIIPLQKSRDETPALLPPSHFCCGDWLIIPDENIPQQELDLDRPELDPEGQIAVGDRIPLSTLMNYYAGAASLRHHRGPRIVLRRFRVHDEFIAR